MLRNKTNKSSIDFKINAIFIGFKINATSTYYHERLIRLINI